MAYMRLVPILFCVALAIGCTAQKTQGVACIEKIRILQPPPNIEAADSVRLALTSSDAKLNEVLEHAKIGKLLFWKEISSPVADDISRIKVKKLGAGHYVLSYSSAYFIDYPTDQVNETGEEFINTARIVLISKEGESWEIKTCPQVR